MCSDTFRWRWLPLSPLTTQRFDAASRIAQAGSPVVVLVVVHGSEDSLIPPALGRALFERAAEPMRLVLVQGGSHHDSNAIRQLQYLQALAELFGL